MRYTKLRKAKGDISVLFTISGAYVIARWRGARLKMLRSNTTFVGVINPQTADTGPSEIIATVMRWWEGIDEVEFFTKLSENPIGKRPMVIVRHSFTINFNATRQEYFKELVEPDLETINE